jgi:zinc transport system substrate-binding protein
MKRLLVFFAWFSACYCKPQVTTTLAPYAYAIEKIAADKVDVSILIPENSNPHIYESKPQDMQTLSKSAIWFCSGEVLEQKLSQRVKARKIDLNADISKETTCHCHHHEHHNSYDLHTWLSPKNYLKQAKLILKILIEEFPENKSLFEANFIELEKEILLLEQEVQKAKTSSEKSLIVSHAAYYYLCHDLGIKQISLEQDGKEASLKHVQDIFKHLQNAPPKTIFAEIQHGDQGAKRLAELFKAKVTYVNPYQKNYPYAIKEVLENLE